MLSLLRKKYKIVLGTSLFTFFCVAYAFSGALAQSARQVNITAYVVNKDGSPLPNGEYDVRLAIYSKNRDSIDPYPSDSDAGSRIWEETQKIYVYEGVLSAYLGVNKPLPEALDFDNTSYFLGTRIGTDSEMAPRKKIGSVLTSLDSSYLRGAKTGDAPGDIPLIGKNGKLDKNLIPVIAKLGVLKDVTWSGDVIDSKYLDDSLSGKTYNGLKLKGNTDGFDISGGKRERKLTVKDDDVSLDQDLLISSSPSFAGLTLSSNLVLGTNTITTSNSGVISNLNADLLDGHHASEFLVGGGTITLSGDVVGSGTTLIATSVIDDSHNHTSATLPSNVSYLGANIDGTEISIVNQAQGDILYYNGAAWVRLAAGSVGQYLQGGTTPSWSVPAGAGDIIDIGDVSSGSAFTASGTQGTSLYFYDADGRGQLTVANLTTARTYTLPDASGTLITTGNLSSINAVGTIVSGTWNGNMIGAQYGGTGVNGATAAVGTILIGNGSGYSLATMGGDATIASTGTLTLATVNSNVGTYNNVVVNAKGQVTAASNVAYLTSYTETDPRLPVVGVVGNLLRSNGSSWTSWTPNYLTSYIETDPIFSASAAYGIVSGDLTNWNNAFTYRLTGVTNNATGLTLSLVSNNLSAAITSGYVIPTTTEETNWNTAFANRIVSANYPLAIASNSISLGYNSTNLQLTANQLNTIQDIATTSSPTFAGLTLNGNLDLGSNTFITSNSTVVTSLNADLLDGQHANAFQTALANPVTGTGTLNYIAKFTATGSTIGNSLIFDNGTSVGIGTTNPTARVSILSAGFDETGASINALNGIGLVVSSVGSDGISVTGGVAGVSASGGIYDFYGTGSRTYFSGNVGIGTTNPGQKLSVVGNIETNRVRSFASSNLELVTAGGLGGTGDIYLSPGMIGGAYENVIIAANGGNVGIGTTSPLVSLHNDGDFITKGPWVDVRAFGAVGDGATDDAPAINNAIASLPAEGGEVRLACGAKYLINSTININKKVHFYGCGTTEDAHYSQYAASVILKSNTLNGPAIEVTQPGDMTVQNGGGGSLLEKFEIMGLIGNGGDGIVILAKGVSVKDVAVYYQGRDGIRVGQDGDGVNANVWYLEGVDVSWNGRHGLFVDDKSSTASLSDANAGTAINVNAAANGGNGVRIGKASANAFYGLLVEINVEAGVYLASNSFENSFFGGDWDEANGSGGTYMNLYIESGATNNKIFGAHFHSYLDMVDTWDDNGTNTVIANADINQTSALTTFNNTMHVGGGGTGDLFIIDSSNTPNTIAGLAIKSEAAGSNYFQYDRSSGWAGKTYIGNNASVSSDAPSTAITIDGTSGNNLVGIGTTSPVSSLEIASSLGANFSISTNGAFGTTAASLYPSLSFLGYNDKTMGQITIRERSGSSLYSEMNFLVRDGSDSLTSRMFIEGNTGNVGIGTTGPGARLDVQGGAVKIGTGAVAGGAGDLSISREAAPTNGYIYFGNTSSNYFGYSGTMYTFEAKTNIYGSTGAINVGTGINNSAVVIAGVNAYDTAVSGYRQIGAFYSSNAMGADVGAGLTLGGVYSGTSITEFAQIAGLKENATDGNYSGALALYTRLNGNAALQERMRINSSGNVGIGTSAPTATLDVVGTANLTNTSLDLPAPGSSGSVSESTINLTLSPSADYTVATGGYQFVNGLTNTQTISSATTSTDLSRLYYYGINNFLSYQANAPTTQIIGLGNRVRTSSTGAVNLLVGESSSAANAGSGTVTTARGATALVSNNGTGTITAGSGLHASIYNSNASGTITTAYGIYADLGSNVGTIGSTYGVYVGDITTGTQTNTPFSFYAEDANAYNFFAGNVGIGTVSPTNNLHIANSIGAVINLQDTSATINSTAFNARVRLTDSTGALAGQMGFGSNDDLVFYNYNTAGNNIIQSGTSAYTLINPTSGNVGIGTTNPSSKLHVVGGAVFSNPSDSSQNIVFSPGLTSLITTQFAMNIRYGMNGPGQNLAFSTYNGEKMRLDYSGNLGIGTISPQLKLDVIGNMRLGLGNAGGNGRGYLGGVWATSEGYKFATLGSTYFNGTNWITNESTDFGSNNVSVMASDVTGIKFYTQISTGNTQRSDTTATFNTYERMRIDMSGNVGIGTTSPTAPLSVGATSQFQVSPAGAVTAIGVNSGTGLIQGTGGLTVTGAAVSLNASSNFAVNIATGTSTGAVSIGGNANTIAIDSSNWNVSSAGVGSGFTGFSSSGSVSFSGDLDVSVISLATINFSGTQPSSVATTPATAAAEIFHIIAPGGGNTSIATTGVGGIGSGVYWRMGTGGAAMSAATQSTGGVGGAINFIAGEGGGAFAAGINIGGNGGAINLTAGDGGDATSGTSQTGGAGGSLTLLAGDAGMGGNANGGTLILNSGAKTGTGTSTISIGSANTTTMVFGNATTNPTFTFSGNGKVGIGTATPIGRLHSYISNSAVTTSTYDEYIQNLATNTTTDAINKYGLYITSTGSFTGSTGTATNNYGIYLNTAAGADNNYDIYAASGAYLSTTGTWTNAPSYRRYKDNYTETSSYLDKLMTLDIYEWQYKNEKVDGRNRYLDDPYRHASPFLDDFYATFNLGTENGFNIQDLAGVSLASVKELNSRFVDQSQKTNQDISGLILKTDVSVDTISALQRSVDGQLSIISEILKQVKTDMGGSQTDMAELINQVTTIDGQLESQSQKISSLESQMDIVKQQNQTILDFAIALNTEKLIYKDELGNVDLGQGKLTIETVEVDKVITRAIEFSSSDSGGENVPDASTGTAKIVAGQSSVKIKTKQALQSAKIFITPKGKSFSSGRVLFYDESDVEDGQGFTVKTNEPITDQEESVEFNWLIIH